MNTMNLRAVLFDLDGTLVDSLGDFHHAANRMLHQLGRAQLEAEMVRGFIGNGQKNFVTRCLMATGGMASADVFAEANQIFTEQYDVVSGQFSAPYEGVLDFVASHAQAQRKQAICTNRPEARAREILAQTGLVDYFDVIVGFESASEPKPSPKPLLKALEVLGVPNEAAIYIGDSLVDAQAAEAARLPFLFHEQGYGELPASVIPAQSFSSYLDLMATANAS